MAEEETFAKIHYILSTTMQYLFKQHKIPKSKRKLKDTITSTQVHYIGMTEKLALDDKIEELVKSTGLNIDVKYESDSATRWFNPIKCHVKISFLRKDIEYLYGLLRLKGLVQYG